MWGMCDVRRRLCSGVLVLCSQQTTNNNKQQQQHWCVDTEKTARGVYLSFNICQMQIGRTMQFNLVAATKCVNTARAHVIWPLLALSMPLLCRSLLTFCVFKV